MKANNAVDDPVSELAPGIFSVLVGKTLGMFTLAIVESVSRVILTVAVGEALGMLILVSVGPVGIDNTTKKSNGLRMTLRSAISRSELKYKS